MEEKDILRTILGQVGIGNRALDLAKRVSDLQLEDTNVDNIKFNVQKIHVYGQTLIARVELKEPFANLPQFREYLEKHNISSLCAYVSERRFGPNMFSILENVSGFQKNPFYAEFFQPERFWPKEVAEQKFAECEWNRLNLFNPF